MSKRKTGKREISKSNQSKSPASQSNQSQSNQSASRAALSRSTPSATLPLGFDSLAPFCAFALFALLLVLAPRFFSGFWPSTYEYWPQALFLSLAACICVLLAISQSSLEKSSIVNRKSSIPLLLLVFGAWCAISVGGTVYLHDSLLELARVAGVLACFFIARRLLQEDFSIRALWLLTAIVAGAVLACAPAIFDFFRTRNPRQFAAFYNPNLFANYCAMALPLAVGGVLLWRQRLRRSESLVLAVGLVFVAAIALGLLVTSSKGGFLAAFCGSLVFVVAVVRAKGERVKSVLGARKAAAGGVALALLVLGGVLFSRTIWPRLTTDLENDHSTMFRVYTWIGTFEMAKARPLTGWGAGSFPSAYTPFAQTGYTRSAHQSWLQIAAESGFPATLLLLAACGVAFARGWKTLGQSPNWPVAAGSMGALTAMLVHGLTDSGWNIVSIAVFLMIVLVLLDRAAENGKQETGNGKRETGNDSSLVTRHASLNWSFLLAAVVLASGSWWSLRAQTGEDLRSESRDLMARGAPASALEKARAAIQADGWSARLWTNLAQAQEATKQNARAAYERATALQPTRALNWLSLAEYGRDHRGTKKEIEQHMQTAVECDPNDTTIRLSRGQWLLGIGEARGWQDLEHIAALADQPYGKYPATPEMVDLNFARAFVRLAARDIERKEFAAAQKHIARGLADLARARQYEDQRRQLEQAAQDAIDYSREREMSELEAQLQALQKSVQRKAAAAVGGR